MSYIILSFSIKGFVINDKTNSTHPNIHQSIEIHWVALNDAESNIRVLTTPNNRNQLENKDKLDFKQIIKNNKQK